MTRSHLWILGSLLLATAAQAQTDQADLVRPSGAADLNNNLAKLATNPRDFNALVGAGEAALELDDARAAAGFFARADAIQPNNGRTKAGLGRVMLKMQNPAEALRLFDQATRAGYPEATIQGDRGLARDMTGDQAGAQRDYHAALQRTPDDAELVRRYAASLGISGQVDAADKVLQPLLYKSDRAAWRYNAFILAMNNRQAEAKKVVDQTMPAQLASAITPYMQKMPYLTAAQKAAAVHFGHFPQVVATSITPIVPTPPAPGVQLASRDAAPAAASTAPAQGDRRTTRNGSGRQRGTSLARAPLGTPAARQPAASQPAASQPAPTQSGTQLAAQATQPAAPTPTPTPTPTPASATVQPLPADTRGRQPIVQPTPSQSARSEMVQPVPGQATAPAPTPAPTPAPVRSASADVQGPPAPGLDALDGGAPRSTAPAPTTGQPSAASQLNSSALAQASSVTPPAPQGTPPAPTPSAPVATQFTPPAGSAAPQPAPEATRSLADIIHAIDVPDSERRSNVVAVDLAEVEKLQAARRAAARQAEADKAKKAAAAKAKAEADAKAKKEAEEKKRLAANPARNWVQIGTGQKSALAFTFKRLQGKYDAVAPQDGWSASWGQTSRLLIGPFASFTRAKAVEADLKKAGADAFAWQSDAGEVVEKLGSK
ncbi:SPOR domain-containing protein [Sphingobium yanoikuyae]|uniref:SPOR domain-containing protein n=2 Tax=Sphingobium yanoikuyae TaxID=13690 RepID=A0AA43B9R9_SPHYA|nr:tetratricopeptide repeat protein [Sphingobium yanoikuyae]MDH2131428.1 SPOR domain-containing protein [Sphingobium yanoikuyae]MDH2167110.1 SPOR domain-containing protein [Sphingobium yanoikuyae]